MLSLLGWISSKRRHLVVICILFPTMMMLPSAAAARSNAAFFLPSVQRRANINNVLHVLCARRRQQRPFWTWLRKGSSPFRSLGYFRQRNSRTTVPFQHYNLTKRTGTARVSYYTTTTTTTGSTLEEDDPIANKNSTVGTATSKAHTTQKEVLPDPSTAPLRTFVSDDFFQTYRWHPNVPPDRLLDLPRNQRIVAIGDVHGDLPALQHTLTLAGVVVSKQNNEWSGGDTLLVSLGDILDRGHHELACLELLAGLSHQAAAEGGAVHFLLGNHESLNAAGLFQYALGPTEYEEMVGKELDTNLQSNRWRLQFAGNQPARWAAMEPGGVLSECTMQYGQVAVQLGRTVCVHAGLTRDHLERYGGIGGMNRQAREWMLTSHHEQQQRPNNNYGEYDSVEDVMEHAQARAQAAADNMPECLGGGMGSESPVWMRDYSQPADAPPRNKQAQRMIDDVLEMLGADRLVMGHTPQRRINAALNGKAWRIDVGVSQGVLGGAPQCLEIIHQGGDNGEDLVSVITTNGVLPGNECMIESLVD